jgi:uncharacterized protein (TIGR02145 family)
MVVSCKKKNDEVTKKPSLDIGNPVQVTLTAFKIDGEVTDDAGSNVTDRGICFGTSPEPTTDDTKLSYGNGTGIFTCEVSGLNPDTRYYIRAYATNSGGIGYSVEKIAVTSNEEVSDYEGNKYQAVKIGDQIWLRNNLISKKYADGSKIKQGGYPADNNESYVELRGRLYSWYAVMNGQPGNNDNPGTVQGICPAGYHVPSDDEWIELELYLGMDGNQAIAYDIPRGDINVKMKYPDPDLWCGTPCVIGNNFSGFSSKPAGFLWKDGSVLPGEWDHFCFFATFWTSTEYSDTTTSLSRLIPADAPTIWRSRDPKGYAYSVRCVKNK